MAVDLEDDELEQEEDKNKPKPKPQAIGLPIAPAPASTGDSGRFQDVRPIMPQPAQTTTPTPIMPNQVPQAPANGGSIGAPINPTPLAPRPRAEALNAGMEPGGRLTTPSYELPKTDPNYQHHPYEKFFDRLAGATNIGRVIESAGGFGTIGHDVNRERAENEAAAENTTIQNAEKERQGEATIGETQARTGSEEANAEAKRAGMENVMITLPNGETVTIPQSQLGPDVRALITQQGAGQRTAATNTSREGIAAGTNQTREDIAAGKTQPHITAMVGGEAHIMERDPATGQYSIDRGKAVPSYGATAPQTRTTELLGADNVMHRFQFNPDTKTYDIDLGPAPTGQSAHQIFQAGAIEDLAPKVIDDINAHREVLGKLSSYYKQWLAGTPISDPVAAQMMGELMSLAAMQPALHAFRSTNAMESFEKLIGGLAKDPDATIATIQGLLKTPQAFTNMAHGGGGGHTKAPARPKGVPQEAVWNAKDKQWQLPNKP